MRVIFFGTGAFAVPILEQLVVGGHQIVRCLTQPDRPQGRGLGRQPSPVKHAALRAGLAIAQPERLGVDQLEGLSADVGVAVAYGQLIPREVLRLPRHGVLGVHPSLLPKYRGAAPVAWAILNGEPVTGVTIFRLTERLDAGEILSRRETAIMPGETAQMLTQRLALLGAQELAGAMTSLAEGQARCEPQDELQATLAPKLTKAQGEIAWGQPAVDIDRLVRATWPWPGASTTWKGTSLKICAASVGDPQDTPSATPGTVRQVTPSAIVVATGQGALMIHELQPAGKRRMSVREFLAGHRINVGDMLGGTWQETGGGG